jgi:hypothetical protein
MNKCAIDFFKEKKHRLIKNNQNWLGIICGPTGTGKSYTGLTIANLISFRPITIHRNVVFSPEELMKKLVNPKELEKGDVLIFDEAGVGMSSRDWTSLQNKLIGSILQTFRNMNLGVIFTTPNLGFIDVQARKLFHNYFETLDLDRKHGLCLVSPYNIQHNSKQDKTYYKRPVYYDDNGARVKMDSIWIAKPNQNIIDDYEQAKWKFTRNLNKNALDQMIDERKRQNHEHKCTFIHYPSKSGWKCKYCGKFVRTNPYQK